MKNIEKRTLEMYRRALASLTADFADLPKSSEGAKAAELLRQNVSAIESASSRQTSHDGSAREGTAGKKIVREAIKEFVRRYSRTAQVIARRKDGFAERFPSPSNATDEQLLAIARSVQNAVGENKADFIKLGISEDYIASADETLESFTNLVEASNSALGSRSAAVSEREQLFDNAEDNFAVLNAYIKNHYHQNPAKLAAWKIASHIERAAQRQKKTPPAEAKS